MRAILFVVCLLPFALQAQSLPDAPSAAKTSAPAHSRAFLIESGASIIATTLDVETTRRAVHSGRCYERNPIVGPHPSGLVLDLTGYGVTGLEIGASALFRKYGHPKLATLVQVATIGGHTVGAINNLAVGCY